MTENLTVVSGGQIGADIAALRAAKACGLKTGGVAPADFITADGKKVELGTEFGLRQLIRARESLSQMYARRSMLNVDQSQATIAFRLQASVGTDKTIGYCRTKVWEGPRGRAPVDMYRPCLVVEDLSDEESAADLIVAFLKQRAISVVNVCGHRDDLTSGMTGFEECVFRVLTAAFKRVADESGQE